MEPPGVIKKCPMKMNVRWGDCDAGGIAYNAKYFDWFSEGRVHLFKTIGLPYTRDFHGQGIELVVIEAACRYKHALLPEEEIVLETCLTRLTRSRMEFKYRVLKKEGGIVAAEGMTVHAYVDREGKPMDIKKKNASLWKKLEDMAQNHSGE